MQNRGLLLAALVLALLGGGVWYSNKLEADKEKKPPADSSPKLFELAEDQFQRIDIEKTGAEKITLERAADNQWKMLAPKALPVDPEAIGGMLSTLGNFTSDKLVDEKPVNLAEFGLTQPVLTVLVASKDGKRRKLLVGDETPTGGGFYAKLEGDLKVYTIYSYNKTGIDKSWKDLREKRLLTFDADKVTRVEISAKGLTAEFGRNAQSEWQILKPQPMRADNLQVDELTRKLKEARMDATLSDEDQAKAPGLFATGTPVATAKVTDARGQQQIEVRKVKEDYYARSSAVEGIYKVGKELGEGLDKPLDEWRNKKLFDFGFSDPSKVDVRVESTTATLVKGGDDWWRAGKKLDSPSVQTLIDKLRDLQAIKFPAAGFTAPAIEMSVVSGDGKRTEKVEVAKSGNAWIARRAGEPALYELDPKVVEEFEQAVKSLKEAAPPAKK